MFVFRGMTLSPLTFIWHLTSPTRQLILSRRMQSHTRHDSWQQLQTCLRLRCCLLNERATRRRRCWCCCALDRCAFQEIAVLGEELHLLQHLLMLHLSNGWKQFIEHNRNTHTHIHNGMKLWVSPTSTIQEDDVMLISSYQPRFQGKQCTDICVLFDFMAIQVFGYGSNDTIIHYFIGLDIVFKFNMHHLE